MSETTAFVKIIPKPRARIFVPRLFLFFIKSVTVRPRGLNGSSTYSCGHSGAPAAVSRCPGASFYFYEKRKRRGPSPGRSPVRGGAGVYPRLPASEPPAPAWTPGFCPIWVGGTHLAEPGGGGGGACSCSRDQGEGLLPRPGKGEAAKSTLPWYRGSGAPYTNPNPASSAAAQSPRCNHRFSRFGAMR